ncbi:MAG: hypothetical protein HY362_04195 [Candidatus Aenigmarchaeota archaeon]|nr:hypothetical protein [Candidatus Aenigmarchaeota archaeon]
MVKGRAEVPGMLDAQFLRYRQSGVVHGAETHGSGKSKVLYVADIGVQIEGVVLYVERRLFLRSPKPINDLSRVLILQASPESLTSELAVWPKADKAYSEFRKSLKPAGPREIVYGPEKVQVPDYFVTWARHTYAASRLSMQVAAHLAALDLLTRPKEKDSGPEGKDLKAPA